MKHVYSFEIKNLRLVMKKALKKGKKPITQFKVGDLVLVHKSCVFLAKTNIVGRVVRFEKAKAHNKYKATMIIEKDGFDISSVGPDGRSHRTGKKVVKPLDIKTVQKIKKLSKELADLGVGTFLEKVIEPVGKNYL